METVVLQQRNKEGSQVQARNNIVMNIHCNQDKVVLPGHNVRGDPSSFNDRSLSRTMAANYKDTSGKSTGNEFSVTRTKPW